MLITMTRTLQTLVPSKRHLRSAGSHWFPVSTASAPFFPPFIDVPVRLSGEGRVVEHFAQLAPRSVRFGDVIFPPFKVLLVGRLIAIQVFQVVGQVLR